MDTEPQDRAAPRWRRWIGPLAVALLAPVATVLLLRSSLAPAHGLPALALYGLLPLAAGAIGIVLLPLTRPERNVALAVYIPVMATLLAYQVPVLLTIACAFGDCI